MGTDKNMRIIMFFVTIAFFGFAIPIIYILNTNLISNTAEVVEKPTIKKQQTKSNPIVKYAFLISSPELIEAGKKTFKTLCVTCHGEDGSGNTPVAQALKPPPRSFLDPKTEWTNGREPLAVFNSISKGSPGTGMVGFEAALSVRKRWELVHFVNSFSGSKGKYTPISEDMIEGIAQNLSL